MIINLLQRQIVHLTEIWGQKMHIPKPINTFSPNKIQSKYEIPVVKDYLNSGNHINMQESYIKNNFGGK